jgi:hypothetical protein
MVNAFRATSVDSHSMAIFNNTQEVLLAVAKHVDDALLRE